MMEPKRPAPQPEAACLNPFVYQENPMLPFCKRNAEELGEDWATAMPEEEEPLLEEPSAEGGG